MRSLVVGFILISVTPVWAGTFTITTTPVQDEVLQFLSVSSGDPVDVVMQRLVDERLGALRQNFVQQEREIACKKFKQLTPAARNAIVTQLGANPCQ